MLCIRYTCFCRYALWLIVLSLLCTRLLWLSPPALAADLNISCGADTCTPQTVDEFFSSTMWVPGSSVSKTISITNASKKNFPVIVEASNIQATGNLDMAIQFTITNSNGAVLWDGPLHSFYTYGPIQVANSLLKGQTRTFTFAAHMYESADDQYQGKMTTFNMTIGNYIFVPTTPIPCTAQKPSLPGWFNISQMSSSDVILYWGPVSTPYTGFTVSWGTDQSASNLGTKNIGKTHEILISGLNLNTRPHYFKVRTVNECALGDYTSILAVGAPPTPTPRRASATPAAPVILSPTPLPTQPSTTPSPSLPSSTVTGVSSPGAVLGASTAKSNPADLIPLFVGVSTATIFVYWIYSRLFL